MQREEDFLNAILANPSDDTARLVYADWLEETSGADSAEKIEFLRAAVEVGRLAWRKYPKERRIHLQQLAATLDTSWLAVVSRLTIESCVEERRSPKRLDPGNYFNFVCDKRWEDLQTTEDTNIRFCAGCQNNVHYCDTLEQARDHAALEHCVAIDLRVNRKRNDLRQTQYITLGFAGPGFREIKDNSEDDE